MKIPALLIAVFLAHPAFAGTTSFLDLKDHFDRYNVDGCFILYSLNTGDYVIYNEARAHRKFSPASTFKIPHTLIGLETGAVTMDTVIPWDGVIRENPRWNGDHTISTAFRYSVVWFYRELARRVGGERMAFYLKKMNYGNREISPSIDTFWLTGGLRITPMGHVDFLRDLYANRFGFKKEYVDFLKETMVLEKSPRYTLMGKTGLIGIDGTVTGWLVGYLERGAAVYIYVTNIEPVEKNDDFLKARLEITRGILKEMKLID